MQITRYATVPLRSGANAIAASAVASIATNPLDIIKTRIQVSLAQGLPPCLLLTQRSLTRW